MKVLNGRIQTWMDSYRPHRLEILVDKLPDYQTRVYDVIREASGASSYFHNDDGYISFMRHNPSDEHGYDGQKFTLNLSDGTVETIKGPWSSGPSYMEHLFGVLAVDVSITDEPKTFEKGYTFYAGHVTEDIAREALAFAGPEWQLISGGSVVEAEASSEQAAIIYDGVPRGWYLARENCPTAYKVEQYLWGPEGRQKLANRASDELETELCINAWHRSKL